MATKEDKKEINGHNYYVRQLPPTKALPLKYELAKILGTAIPSLLSGKGKDSDVQAEAFGKALDSIFNSVSPDQLMALIKRVVETATRDGQRIMDGSGENTISFDEAFIDDYQEMYQVFFFVLEVNFGNFIKGFGLNLDKLKEAAAEKLNG